MLSNVCKGITFFPWKKPYIVSENDIKTTRFVGLEMCLKLGESTLVSCYKKPHKCYVSCDFFYVTVWDGLHINIFLDCFF